MNDNHSKRKRDLRCQFCSNVYQKKEHLERHERTHTGAKPFVCTQCQRSFSRHDSLIRHERVHAPKTRTPRSTKPQISAVQEAVSRNVSNDSIVQSTLNAQANHVHQHDVADPVIATANGSQLGMGEAPFFAETEDFFQYLLSTPAGWPASLPTDISNEAQFVDPALGFQQSGKTTDDSPEAVQQVGAMITEVSSSVTKEINARGITSSFLDACLHLFFSRFNPTFPVLHEATFNINLCGPFLLLNMVALGSLFFGSSDAVSKGEFLWRLAQTAAATSWGDVFEEKFGLFKHEREQIVTTALLGQIYAMLSRSRRLRTLCQSLQGLAFSWARQFGMYDLPDELSHAPLDDYSTPEERAEQWRAWAAVEVKRRTLLGLYIVDAQLARFSGSAPVGKHATNPLKFASKDTAFEARTAVEWLSEMKQDRIPASTFREIFLALFYPSSFSPGILLDSQLSKLVILEGFQAILSEHADAAGSALGIPPIDQIVNALLFLKKAYLDPADYAIENREHLLRWHNLCLDIATDSVLLCQRLCAIFPAHQSLFTAGRSLPIPIDLTIWAMSPESRKALLHALAILKLSEGMTLGRAYPAHLPACLFAAATVLTAYCRYGQQIVVVPDNIDWNIVWDHSRASDALSAANADGDSDIGSSDTYRFVMEDRTCTTRTKQLNLRYSLLTLQMTLQTISSQWGIAHDMLAILSIWISGLD